MVTYEATFTDDKKVYIPKMPIIAKVIESENSKIMSTTAILEQICEVYKTDVTIYTLA